MLSELIIAEMTPGESGWTVPWCLHRSGQGGLSLNGEYTLTELAGRAGRTNQMKVKRDCKGWTVDITRCPLKALAEMGPRKNGEAYVGGDNSVPVRRVVWFNPLTVFARETVV